jgi:hypothetical protein
MAMGKKQDISDIIRGAIDAMGKPKRRVAGKPQRKPPDDFKPRGRRQPLGGAARQMPRRPRDKPFDREESILPRRPKPKNPTPPSRRQMPKRKPTAGPTKRKGNY